MSKNKMSSPVLYSALGISRFQNLKDPNTFFQTCAI
jgi:hypothetical protein